MTLVDDNRLKGNYAAALVSARLSTACLVRPVAGDTDVGVDLYCETVEQGVPFLHFWVQVKSGDQCKVAADGETCSCSFSTAHLAYWARQPVPVFAALVPVEWPVKNEPRIYIVDLTKHLLSGHLKMDQQTQTLSSHEWWTPGNSLDVPYFLNSTVPHSVAVLKCREGMIASIPTLEPQYFKQIPSPEVERYSDEILRQLRTTASWSIISMWRRNTLTDITLADFRRALAAVAAELDDHDHWESPAARAFSAHIDGEFALAVPLYEEAIDIIQRDDATQGKPEWEIQCTKLANLRDKAMEREAFGPGPV